MFRFQVVWFASDNVSRCGIIWQCLKAKKTVSEDRRACLAKKNTQHKANQLTARNIPSSQLQYLPASPAKLIYLNV